MKQSVQRALCESIFLRACSVQAPADWNGFTDSLRAARPEDWRWIERTSHTHGLTGLLARNLTWAEQHCSIAIPILEDMNARRRKQLVPLLVRQAAARRVCKTLEQNGVPLVLFKGIALVEEVLGDLSLREFGDCDILVRPERLEDARHLLDEIGYHPAQRDGASAIIAPEDHAMTLRHHDGTSVDLHWLLSGAEFSPENVDLIWSNTCPPSAPNALPGLRLNPELNFLYQCTHFYWHGFNYFKPMFDAYAVARSGKADFARLVPLARALNRLEISQLTARLCLRDFPALPLLTRLSEMPARLGTRFAYGLLGRARLVRPQDGKHKMTAHLTRPFFSGNASLVRTRLRLTFLPKREWLSAMFGKPYRPTMYPRLYMRKIATAAALAAKFLRNSVWHRTPKAD